MISNHCKAVEDYGKTLVAEKIAEKSFQVAEILIKQNVLSVEQIAEVSGLEKAEILKLAEKVAVKA